MDCMTLCVYVCIAPVTARGIEDDPPDYFSFVPFGF